MRTPSSALPACPHGLVLGRGKPFAAAALAGLFDFNFTSFLAAGFDLALPLAFAVLGFLVAISPSPSFLLMPGGHASSLFLANCALRVEIADAAAFAARCRIDHRVDEGRLAGIHGLVHGPA